ncbi:ABC-F family ATP-binding cassette domain-containing protein [Deinococcus hohokamensis]|uniref:ABC-F family ATP-binding cassette domain-containing protein n=1 Tax=Deinococcus hohokamensis TaxID=309883 RepID=A0ABV9I7J4_9DEIO
MLHATGVARIFGDRPLFQELELHLGAGERLALIGENGSGKSTLLRLLSGLDVPDAGQVTSSGRVALLAQHAELGGGRVLDAVIPDNLRAVRARYAEALARLEEESDEALTAFADAEDRYRRAGGYAVETHAAQVLAGLGLAPDAETAQLSGGEARRVMLARLLLSPADVYLLDEPTNHLDADGARWLEGWLQASDAAFVLASHDRAFLDAVATSTAELERGRLTVYPGGYSEAMALKATLRGAQQRAYEAHGRRRAALEAEGSRLKSAGQSANTFSHRRAGNVPLISAKNKAQNVARTLAGRARALERRLDRLEAQAVSKPYEDHRTVRLALPPGPPGPNEVLVLHRVQVVRDGRVVLPAVSGALRRGERVALTGPNGSGKSSLLQALRQPAPGVRWGQGLTLYAAQQHGEELAGFATVGDALLDANPGLSPHQLHEVGAQVQLPGPSFPVAALSGGQRTRLSLARLSVTRAQMLLLDEPTNHLDLGMIQALEALLLGSSSTVLFASHDRRLVQRVATQVWLVRDGEVVIGSKVEV